MTHNNEMEALRKINNVLFIFLLNFKLYKAKYRNAGIIQNRKYISAKRKAIT